MRLQMATVAAIGMCAAALVGCGGGAPVSPRQSAIPVLVYRDVQPKQLAHQLDQLHGAGYDTITLATFTRFLRGQPVKLPPRPFLLTFDHGRRAAFKAADEVLRDHGFNAVGFIDVGRVTDADPAYLSWGELDGLQRDRRWEIQLESGTGNFLMRYGPAPGDVGPFYAYRGTDEVLGGWRERVFGDLSVAERQLTHFIHGYRPLAVAPPYGNYGQAGTNDPEIPRLLLARLQLSFPLVFTQDRPPLTARGAGTAERIGRLELTPAHGDRDLQALLSKGTP
ncbi:hypothetical protein OM076_03240 [Solirubrobacter ginsenosidimutans]|uniref:Polysaccharide deacetylase family protein n=1 Tax=Solirubrobacter ginsenosidimutans TaxID=490573 RepID=A0A9X3RYK5_9ACTN|nr:hypothetical protein [Solirubrobacter ginsenosidimutans]MDA0159269.1 hypothetical protein [Solirubrobacter ginsenosidimutans]